MSNRNPQRIATPKESASKKKLQAQDLITEIFLYLATSLDFHLFHIVRKKKRLKEITYLPINFQDLGTRIGDSTGFNSELRFRKGYP